MCVYIFICIYINMCIYPGATEADELYKIVAVLGTPSAETWQEGLHPQP